MRRRQGAKQYQLLSRDDTLSPLFWALQGQIKSVDISNDIIEIIKAIRKHQGFREDAFDLNAALYDNGLGLDSLCVAELSAVLEKKYGKDPYTSGILPQTVRDIVDFYS